MGATLVVTESFNHLYDFILFPAVILWLGTVVGWLVLTIGAFALNYYFAFLYKNAGFGEVIEWIRVRKDSDAQGFRAKCIKFILRMGYWPTFVLLSWDDPSKAFFFARGDKLGERFTAADWQVLFLANAIGTIIWAGMWGAGISGIRHLLQ